MLTGQKRCPTLKHHFRITKKEKGDTIEFILADPVGSFLPVFLLFH